VLELLDEFELELLDELLEEFELELLDELLDEFELELFEEFELLTDGAAGGGGGGGGGAVTVGAGTVNGGSVVGGTVVATVVAGSRASPGWTADAGSTSRSRGASSDAHELIAIVAATPNAPRPAAYGFHLGALAGSSSVMHATIGHGDESAMSPA
jgi:hypothetical protein